MGITSRGPRAGAEFRMGRPRTVRSTSRSSSERRLLGRLGFLLGLVMVAGVWAGQDTQDACPPARLLPMSDTGYLSPDRLDLCLADKTAGVHVSQHLQPSS